MSSLLEKAKQAAGESKLYGYKEEEIELAIAVLCNQVSLRQASEARGRGDDGHGGTAYRLFNALKFAYTQGRLKVTYEPPK